MKKKIIKYIVEERYFIGVIAGIVSQVTSEMCNAHFKSVWAEILPVVLIMFVFGLGVEIARSKNNG